MTAPSRGFATIAVLVIVLALLAGTVGYAVLQNKSYFETASQSSTSTDTISKSLQVKKLNWNIELANPSITNPDDYHKYEQKISVTVTFLDGSTKQYALGNAYGCSGSIVEWTLGGGKILGTVRCDFAESGTSFVAYSQNGQLVVERRDQSAKDGSIKTTVLLTIPVDKAALQTGPAVPGMSSYTSSENGFTFQYPTTMQIQTSGYQSWPSFNTPPVAYIELRNDEEQTEGYLTFNVGTGGKFSQTQNCPNPGDSPGDYLMIINGQNFSRREILGPGGGIERDFTIQHNGVCYAMVVAAFPSACVNSGCTDPKWSAKTEKALLDKFDPVIQSFRFTGSI